MFCPACGHHVMDGDEFCEDCRYPLLDWERQTPRSNLERNIIRDRIRCLSPRSPHIASPATPVGEVIRMLVDREIGSVIIVEDDRILGIFSERDVLWKLNTEVHELRSRPVSEFMTRHVETIDLDDKLALALHKMDLGGYRHLPVTDEDKLCGIISIRDIMRYMTETILTVG